MASSRSNLSIFLLVLVATNGVLFIFNLHHVAYMANQATIAALKVHTVDYLGLGSKFLDFRQLYEFKMEPKRPLDVTTQKSRKDEYRSFLLGLVVRAPDKNDTKGNETLLCEAVIVHTSWAITAAVCIIVKEKLNIPAENIYLKVYLGGTKDWKEGFMHSIAESLMSGSEKKAGMALLKGSPPFSFPSEIAIPIGYLYFFREKRDVLAYGWSKFRVHADYEKEKNPITVSTSFCEEQFNATGKKIVDELEFCTSICQMLPGSPILSEDLCLIGIASRISTNCTRNYIPGVYLKFLKHRKWINGVLK